MRKSGRLARALIAGAGLVPFFGLVAGIILDRLGPEPVDTLTHETGAWALRMLIGTLAVSPARRLLGWAWLAVHRRTFGLLGFFYAMLHFTTYIVFGLEFDMSELATDIRDRPYITVGFATLVLLTPLALTSTRHSIRSLGSRWRTLHRLVYVAAPLAVVHFFWSVKVDPLEPLVYGAITAGLLLLRLYWTAERKRRSYATLPRSSRGDASSPVPSGPSDEAA